MNEVNIYCDESNHLLLEPKEGRSSIMVLGSVSVPKEKRVEVTKRLKEFKIEHGLSTLYEMKWTKVSASKLDFFLDIVNYFFDSADLSFRAVVINKADLNHGNFHQTHDEWYYKMYFYLLRGLLSQSNAFNIYIDLKDTRGGLKVSKLDDVLRSSQYDFDRKIVKKVQQIRSNESDVLQLADILIGAIQHLPIAKQGSPKSVLIEKIKERSGFSLSQSTLLTEKKFNLFYWHGRQNGE